MNRIFICLIVFVSSYALSQWSTNPYENLQVAEHGGNIHVSSDGNGGAIVTFNNFADVVKGYMQMIDKYGYLKWNEPMVILDGPGLRSYVIDIFRNPDGTILIGYTSGYTYVDPIPRFEYDPYVQKIDSNGNKLWGENGIRLRADSTGKEISGIYFCYDGDGGLFSFWNFKYAVNYPPYNYDSLFIQHISKDGVRLWGENGIFVDDSIFSALNSWVIIDDNGGIYLQYRQTSTECYINKFNSLGNLSWTLSNSIISPIVIEDSFTGIIISGVNVAYPASNLIINRISSEGEKLWGDGIIVDDSVGNSSPPLIFLNMDNTTSVFWDTEWWPNDDVFLQRYTLDGEQVWAEPIRVSDIISAKSRLGLINSNSNSNIVAWAEGLDSSAQFAHKINSDGIKLWNEKKLISTNYSTDETKVLTDDNDGAIIVWRIDPPWGGIYAQQISKYGNLGEVITSIKEDENNTKHNDFNLTQNYPNPFNSTTQIKYSVKENGFVAMKVYDVLGSEIATLINEEKSVGKYDVEFDGSGLSSGIYFYQLTAGSFSETKKMILLR